MRNVTLCLPLKGNQILLGIKKVGFGKDKLNGFGGKVQDGETIEQATIRELFEEVGLLVKPEDLEKFAELNFSFPYAKDKNWDQTVHVYIVSEWQNPPRESEEMGFEWIDLDKIPFERMWDSDKYWLPMVLEGKKIKANLSFGEDNNTIKNKEFFPLAC